MKDKNNKSFIYGLSIIILMLFCLALYGFYEKNRGWTINNNRFFTNGKIIKTIGFCKSAD
jgi:hypothetical protein